MTSIHLRPITESDLPVLDRLAVDPRIAGPLTGTASVTRVRGTDG